MKRFAVSLAAAALVLTLGAAARAQDSTSTAPASPAPASESKPMHHARHHKGAAVAAVDINSATKEQLMTLPGIDDATADKIVSGRPFATRYDLVKKSIVTKAAYAKLKGKIMAKKAS
jgi:DNA uptake protein ComE-like DNA-binding protein